MPKSIERDFYIWQFLLQEKTTKEQASKAGKLVAHINSKLDSAFFKKTGLHLQLNIRKKVKQHQPNIYYTKLISQMQQSGNFYKAWLQLKPKDKLAVFNLCSKENRKLLNKPLNKEIFLSLTKYSSINEFLARAKTEHLNYLENLLKKYPPEGNNRVSYNKVITLAFKNLKLNKDSLAQAYFKAAIYSAKTRFNKDRALFWSYMTTKNRKYLLYLARSYDFNIYKLIALDFLQLPYPNPPKAYINPYEKSPIRINDPIAWAILKRKIFSHRYNLYNLAKKYNSPKSAGYYYFILLKASKDTKQYFPLLYRDIISKYPIERQAMIYALARQESHFIPASISRSFALGMMQFMPFLIKEIAKQRGENIGYRAIFNPKIAIVYANDHLNYLNKYLYNPLFVAYAYNAGIGYTRKLLNSNLFRNKKRYDPYMSLELVENQQANHYGKKVLANYVIYRMLLGSPIRITTLLNQLDKPNLTDRFR